MTPNRCLYCGRWYAMAPRLYLRQKTCGDEQCRSKHKAALNRKWRKEHPDEQKERDKAVAKRRKDQRLSLIHIFWRTPNIESKYP